MSKRNYDLSQNTIIIQYDYARSNGVDLDRENAIDQLFKLILETSWNN